MVKARRAESDAPDAGTVEPLVQLARRFHCRKARDPLVGRGANRERAAAEAPFTRAPR